MGLTVEGDKGCRRTKDGSWPKELIPLSFHYTFHYIVTSYDGIALLLLTEC